MSRIISGGSDEPEDSERIIDNDNALAAISQSELNMQIVTARRFPRSIKRFKEEALALATLDESTAQTMFYALVRGGKRIEGPSVRLAEVAGSAWGNLHYGARTVDVADRMLRAQGVAWDLEKNVRATIEVSRRITNKQGKRYDDDMITVTSQAACKVALRNALWTVIPMALIKPIYEAAKVVALGQGLSMEQRRTRALEWFGKLNVKPEELFAVLGRKGIEDVTIDDLTTLQGLRTAIMDGETTVEEAFREIRHPASTVIPGATGSKLDALADTLKANGAAKAEDKPIESPTPTTDDAGQIVIPS